MQDSGNPDPAWSIYTKNLDTCLLLQLLPWEGKRKANIPPYEKQPKDGKKLKKKKKEKKTRAERGWRGTHLLYHRAFAPPNLSNPPKSLCKRQKERKRKIKCHESQGRKVLFNTRFQKGSLKGRSPDLLPLVQRLTVRRAGLSIPRGTMTLSTGPNPMKHASKLRLIIPKFPIKGSKGSYPIKK